MAQKWKTEGRRNIFAEKILVEIGTVHKFSANCFEIFSAKKYNSNT